jgi:hypothetical protein
MARACRRHHRQDQLRVTATDRFGRAPTFTPFAAIPSQLAIIE